DLGQLPAGALQDLRVLAGLAEAHVDDDLLEARHGHDVVVAVALHQLLLDSLVALLRRRLYLPGVCHFRPHSSSSAPLRLATGILVLSSWPVRQVRVDLPLCGSAS